MKTNCPAGCGKRFINEQSAKQHMTEKHPTWSDVPKQKGWATPHGFVDCRDAVSYEEACEIMKTLADGLFDKLKGATNDK